MSDTPRTETERLGSNIKNQSDSDKEWPWSAIDRGWDFARQLERELAAVTAERDALRADLCTFAVDMERQLSAVTAERDSMVARFRDEINQRQETQRANAIVDAAILSASQQEARRLREALDKLHIVCETSKPEIYDWYLTDSFASDARQSALEALASTPAPVQK